MHGKQPRLIRSSPSGGFAWVSRAAHLHHKDAADWMSISLTIGGEFYWVRGFVAR
jgi:hypothetical protein